MALPYLLPVQELWQLHRRSYKAQQDNGAEVCGIIGCGCARRLCFQFLRNCSPDAYSYALDPDDLEVAVLDMERRGLATLGSFHSHPVGYAEPSAGDIEKGFFRGIELVYDVCGHEVKLWRKYQRRGANLTREIPLFTIGRKFGVWRPL